MCCCSKWISPFLFCLKTKEMLRAAITTPLSRSASTTLMCPRRLRGMTSIHNTHTLMSRLRSCFAMWAAVCHVTKGQWAAARPLSDVCSAIQLVPSAAPPPTNSSHTTPAPPSSVTGHPWRHWSWSVATRVRLWGGRRIGCHLREVELHAGGGEMGRRCTWGKKVWEFYKGKKWLNVGRGKVQARWMSAGGKQKQKKNTDIDPDEEMMSKWEEEARGQETNIWHFRGTLPSSVLC